MADLLSLKFVSLYCLSKAAMHKETEAQIVSCSYG